MRLTTILTSEQAALLYGLVKAHRAGIIEKWSPGIYDGLLLSLMQIDRGGGALSREHSRVLSYGGDVVETAILPPSTYIAWRGAKTLPRPYWDLAAMLPRLSIKDEVVAPVTVYRAIDPLAIIPLPAAVVPPLPLN